jgi:CubicO group peptidase (beta-lactamase class C family)
LSGYLSFSLICILFATACSHFSPRVTPYGLPQREYTYQQPEAVDDGWDTASLNETDINPEKIDEMMLDILGGNDKNIHSVLLIKNGKLILEEYFYGYNRDTSHFLASVSKSITSILIGIAIDQKIAADVELNGWIKNIRLPFNTYSPWLPGWIGMQPDTRAEIRDTLPIKCMTAATPSDSSWTEM